MMEFLKNKILTCFIFCFLTGVVLLGPNPAKGEEIGLEQALQLFYRNNYDIIINRYEVDKAQGEYVGAKLLPNPNLSLNYLGLTSGLSAGDNTQMIFRLDQLIELGGKRGYRIQSAAETWEASKLTHQDTIRGLLIGFYNTFFNLLLNELNIDFALEELKRYDRVLEIGSKRHQTGFLSLLDYTKLTLARIDLENSLTQINNQYKNDLETFNLLLGGQGGFKPLKGAVKEDFPEMEEKTLLETAYTSRYDLLSLQRQVKSAEYNQKLASVQKIPDITVGGEYETWGQKAEPGIGAGISLNIPIFSRGQGELLKRTAEFNQLKAQIEKTKKQIVADIKQGLNNYRSGLKMFDGYKARKEDMSTLVANSEKAFSLGGITVLELLDTHKTYRDFITKYNQSLIQSALNKALIKVYSGEIK
jgi:cobalt-zinc-cadmium efflux system outer membrane protein